MSTTSEQVSDRQTRHRDVSECKSLIAASTKDLFRKNAFRITGLAVDATAREVIDMQTSSKCLLELGQDPHTKNNALSTETATQDLMKFVRQFRSSKTRRSD